MRKRVVGLPTVLALGVAGLAMPGSLLAAQATEPGSPGEPQPATVVYEEDFENRPGPTPVVRLDEYESADGIAYTADPEWLTNCNGWIASAEQPVSGTEQVADCVTQNSWNRAQQLSHALGLYVGAETPAANFATSAYTAGDPGAGLVEFETVENIPFTAGNGRFITFSVDVAAVNCGVSAPQLQFQLLDDDGAATNVGAPVNGCVGGVAVGVPGLGAAGGTAASVSTATSAGSLLFAGESVGVRMLNNNGSGVGNDHAFDNLQIVDASPQLDKSFSPTEVGVGQAATLTFTVTNTDELAAKPGWSFTDTLPEGLVVADGAASTTCSDGTVDAAAGAGAISVTGNLDAGQAACTVTVNVTSTSAGSYTNGPDNIESTGLNPPAESTVVFEELPPIFFGCSSMATFDGDNENWRAATTRGGTTVVRQPASVGWTADQGNPDGAVISNDLDSNWTELWTPPLAANGYAIDYSFAVGEDLQFDYRNNTGIGYDLYAGVVGANGAHYWYVFRDQITDSTAWNRVVVPMDASQWVTGFSNNSGPIGPAPSDEDFLAAIANVDRFVFSLEGRNGPDITLLDNFGQPCDDFGDAPASYATTGGADNGPRHRLVGLDETGVAPLMLGEIADVEDDGVPTPDADGDDTTGLSDEDGVTTPLLAATGEPLSVPVTVTNSTEETATLVGWVDADGDGTFDEAPVQLSVPAAAGTAEYTLEFPGVEVLENTYARFRLFAGDIAEPLPTGPVVGGEVEDYLVTVDNQPELEVVKSADGVAQEAIELDQEITYSFQVTNTGNVTITDVTIDELDFTGTGDLSEIACPAGAASLAPGAEVTCTATYTVTQEDVDAGSIENTASATGTPPGGGDPIDSPPAQETVPAPPEPALEMVKSADGVAQEAIELDQEITYSFQVTNTGNVTITDVTIDELDFTGTGDLSEIACPAGAASLAPGAEVTCTATYTVTQEDVDAGSIENVASATGTPPGSDEPIGSPPSQETVPAPQQPALDVFKYADTEMVTDAGQEITYSFLVTNTGNVTITDVNVLEGEFTGTGELSELDCPAGVASMAPGADLVCTATYTVTQEDVDAGSIENVASATGTPPGSDEPIETPPSTSTIEVDQNPELNLVKTADTEMVTDAGQEITYSFLVTNTGNVTITDVNVLEGEFTGTGELSEMECSAGLASLAPGAEVTCAATYTVTQEDVDAGSIENTATATGTPPGSDEPIETPPSTSTIEVDQNPELNLVKTADTEMVTDAGQEITYSFLVTNTGNVTITDVNVLEGEFTGTGELSELDCPAGVASMAPGADLVCTATYTVTQEDVDAGSIENTATATGTPPGSDEPISSEGSSVTVDADPAETPELPTTGTQVAALLGLAALLLAGGGLAIRHHRKHLRS